MTSRQLPAPLGTDDAATEIPIGADIVHAGGGRAITKRGVPLTVYVVLLALMLVGFALVDTFRAHVAVAVATAVLYFIARDATEDDPDWPTVAAARLATRGPLAALPGVRVVYERRAR